MCNHVKYERSFLMSRDNSMRLVTVSLLLALEVILGTFFTVNFAGIAKIGFGFHPIAMIAIMYGPLWSGAAYAIGDILAWFIKPEGAYFPGLTFTCLCAGVIMGLFLYKKDITIEIFVEEDSNKKLFNLNDRHLLMHQGFLALLPSRVVKCIITYVAEVLLVPLVWNKLMLRIPSVHEIISKQ